MIYGVVQIHGYSGYGPFYLSYFPLSVTPFFSFSRHSTPRPLKISYRVLFIVLPNVSGSSGCRREKYKECWTKHQDDVTVFYRPPFLVFTTHPYRLTLNGGGGTKLNKGDPRCRNGNFTLNTQNVTKTFILVDCSLCFRFFQQLFAL